MLLRRQIKELQTIYLHDHKVQCQLFWEHIEMTVEEGCCYIEVKYKVNQHFENPKKWLLKEVIFVEMWLFIEVHLYTVLQPLKCHITKTCLYIFDRFKPHFCIVKLGFTGVFIIFLISAQNIDCGYSLEPFDTNEYSQSIFWAES